MGFWRHTVSAARLPALLQQLPTKSYLGGCPGWVWLLGISFGLASIYCTQLPASLLQSRRLTSPVFLFTRIAAILKMG